MVPGLMVPKVYIDGTSAEPTWSYATVLGMIVPEVKMVPAV